MEKNGGNQLKNQDVVHLGGGLHLHFLVYYVSYSSGLGKKSFLWLVSINGTVFCILHD